MKSLRCGWNSVWIAVSCHALLDRIRPQEQVILRRDGRNIVTGIQFLTDEKGRKVAVQIDLRKHKALCRIFTTALSRRRRKEKGILFETVKAGLVKRGLLRS
jgi:hypothetical protein